MRLNLAALLVPACLLWAPVSKAADVLPPACSDVAIPTELDAAAGACAAAIEAGNLAGDGLAEAYRRRGVVLARARHADKALDDFDAALAIRPDWVQAMSDKGRALILQNDYRGAAAILSDALDLDPELSAAHDALAWVRHDDADSSGAFDEWSRAFELDPKNWHALAARAITASELGRQVAALEDVDRAAAAPPEELARVYTIVTDGLKIDFATEVQFKRCKILERLGRFEDAAAGYEAMLRRYPNLSWAAVALSWVRANALFDQAGALDVLTEAAKRDPRNWRILTQKAKVLAMYDDKAAARAVLAELVPPATPADGAIEFRKARGMVLRILEDFDGAKADVIEGVRLSPGYRVNVVNDMLKRGYLMDVPGVAPERLFADALDACVRDTQCAYWE